MIVYDVRHGFFVGSHQRDRFHHSSFFAGEPVTFAGEWQVVEGKIVGICNKSGHYQPGWVETARFLTDLHRRGVDLRGVRFELVGGDHIGELTGLGKDPALNTRMVEDALALKDFLEKKLVERNRAVYEATSSICKTTTTTV